jgi:hypothetical protein
MSQRSLLTCFLDILPGMAGIYRPRHPERTVLYRVKTTYLAFGVRYKKLSGFRRL